MPVKRTSRSADKLHLEHFVPYRLSVLTNIVSMSIAEAYERETSWSKEVPPRGPAGG